MKITYEFKSHIELIKARIRILKLNFRRVSEQASIHPSYFSRVIKGNGRFSQGQIFQILELLNFSQEEMDFVFLLWSLSEATTRSEKEFFEKKINLIRNEMLKVSANIPISELDQIQDQREKMDSYYAEAITAEIHMLLTIPRYRENPEELRLRCNLPKSKFEAELQKLYRTGLIKLKNEKISQVLPILHLDETHPMSQRNHINWRLKSIQNLEIGWQNESDYHLSVVFSADQQTKVQIKDTLRRVVVETAKMVQSCTTNGEVNHFNIDLY
jgi:hypothetical protein